jgi:hypothetical protein
MPISGRCRDRQQPPNPETSAFHQLSRHENTGLPILVRCAGASTAEDIRRSAEAIIALA